MDRELNLAQYLPEILHEVKELKELARTENPELAILWNCLENALDDQFVQSSTENGVKRWESILKITAKGTDSISDRKFRVLTRLNEQLPYSYRMLQQQLAALCGEEGYVMRLNHTDYTLTVKVELIAKSNFDDVGSLLRRTVPANMIIDLSLKYNQHSTLKRFTHVQLAAYTQHELRNEVIT